MNAPNQSQINSERERAQISIIIELEKNTHTRIDHIHFLLNIYQ